MNIYFLISLILFSCRNCYAISASQLDQLQKARKDVTAALGQYVDITKQDSAKIDAWKKKVQNSIKVIEKFDPKDAKKLQKAMVEPTFEAVDKIVKNREENTSGLKKSAHTKEEKPKSSSKTMITVVSDLPAAPVKESVQGQPEVKIIPVSESNPIVQATVEQPKKVEKPVKLSKDQAVRAEIERLIGLYRQSDDWYNVFEERLAMVDQKSAEAYRARVPKKEILQQSVSDKAEEEHEKIVGSFSIVPHVPQTKAVILSASHTKQEPFVSSGAAKEKENPNVDMPQTSLTMSELQVQKGHLKSVEPALFLEPVITTIQAEKIATPVVVAQKPEKKEIEQPVSKAKQTQKIPLVPVGSAKKKHDLNAPPTIEQIEEPETKKGNLGIAEIELPAPATISSEPEKTAVVPVVTVQNKPVQKTAQSSSKPSSKKIKTKKVRSTPLQSIQEEDEPEEEPKLLQPVTVEKSIVVLPKEEIVLPATQPATESIVHPVMHTITPIIVEQPVPIVTQKPVENSDNETLEIFNTQSSWDLSLSAEKKKQLLADIQEFEKSMNLVEGYLNNLVFTVDQGFEGQAANFIRWNQLINQSLEKLQELKSVDQSLYEKKLERFTNVQKLFATQLYNQLIMLIKLMRNCIFSPTEQLGIINKKKGGLFSDKTEFQKLCYQFFFGLFGTAEWDNSDLKTNIPWFKDNYVKKFNSYWIDFAEYKDLSFEYRNTKEKGKGMAYEQFDVLKSKMQPLYEEIKQYDSLLKPCYDGMITLLGSLPSKQTAKQKAALDPDPKNHIKVLEEAQASLTNDFLKRLWPKEVI